MALKKSELYSSLWNSCDELRGGMDASQYKDYVLVLLFIKYVSDKYGDGDGGAIEVPVGGRFEDLVKLKGSKNIGDGMNKIMAKLAEANDLNGVIDVVDFNNEDKLGKGKEMQDRLTNLISIFESPALNFSKNRADGDDILGDAYEYLMRNFATQSGKSKGQFYTPAEVSRVMAKVLGINRAKVSGETTIYDPTCGSGSLLLKVADEAGDISIYGQEMDNSTYALARMNMFLHNHPTAEIYQGNTLADPANFGIETGDRSLPAFDFAVANPPFSTKSWSNGLDPANDLFGRFDGYGIPPAKNGDYAFLLHFVGSLKSTGKGAIILPHGVLFRGNVEGDIRQNMIKRGYIQGIIGLPPNLFYGTGIPACIIVIDKEKANKRQGIFMIDASKGFTKDGDKNRLRERDIHKIVDVFNKQLTIPKYSRLVSLEEIAANDYNLNIPRYIDSQEDEDIQNIAAHLYGGIPLKDIEDLAEYWQVYPNLRDRLFAPIKKRKGFFQLRVEVSEIKNSIFQDGEFIDFQNTVQNMIEAWRNKFLPSLKKVDKLEHPKQLINDLAEDILSRFADVPLIDQYDVYEHLMVYWEGVMKDDVYLIMENGWQAEVLPVLDKKGKAKKDEWVCDLIPKSLVIERFLREYQEEVEDLVREKEMAVRYRQELEEEYSGEDGFFDDLRNDKGNLPKEVIKVRMKELKKGDQERQILESYWQFLEEEARLEKNIKEAERSLDQLLLEKYQKLTVKDIQLLVIEDKWMATISQEINTELERISQALAGRIKELADRYMMPLPALVERVNSLSEQVDQHLQVLVKG